MWWEKQDLLFVLVNDSEFCFLFQPRYPTMCQISLSKNIFVLVIKCTISLFTLSLFPECRLECKCHVCKACSVFGKPAIYTSMGSS